MQSITTKDHRLTATTLEGLQQEMDHYFSKSRHQLVIMAHGPEALKCISKDFGHMAFVRTCMAPGNLFEPHNTESVYREIKGYNPFIQDQYWEQEMQSELEEFRKGIEVLASLEYRYSSHSAVTCADRGIALSFVASRAGSPLMAVYNGGKVMVYNFSC